MIKSKGVCFDFHHASFPYIINIYRFFGNVNRYFLVPPVGFEPTTPWLQIRCSTSWAIRANFGASDRTWTCIFHSVTLYGFSPATIPRHYSVFRCTTEGIEPSFQTNARYQAAHGIEPCFPPGFHRNRTGITSIVHVKIEILFLVLFLDSNQSNSIQWDEANRATLRTKEHISIFSCKSCGIWTQHLHRPRSSILAFRRKIYM